MDSSMSSEELERLKERTKINFFQVEKRLAEDDARMDNLEKSLNEIKDLKKSLGKYERQNASSANTDQLGSQLSAVNSTIKHLESEISQVWDSMQKLAGERQSGSSDGINGRVANLVKNMAVLEDEIRQIKNRSSGEWHGADKDSENLRNQVSAISRDVSYLAQGLQKLRQDVEAASSGKESAPLEKVKSQILELTDALKIVKEEVSEAKGHLQKIKGFEESRDEYIKGIRDDLKNFVGQMPELEEEFTQVRKDLQEIDALKAELGSDRKLYLELRNAVLASVEKFAGLEKDFSRRLEELGELSRNVEATRKLNEVLLRQAREELSKFEESSLRLKGEMREEVKDEVTRLEAEGSKLEQLIASSNKATKNEVMAEIARLEDERTMLEKMIEDMNKSTSNEIRSELAKVSDKAGRLEMFLTEGVKVLQEENKDKFERLKSDVNGILDKGFEKQNNRITEYGDKVDAVAVGFTRLKTDVVERTIDEEMNKLLIILNDKLKSLVTRDEMDNIRTELRYRLEQVRTPEIRPLEARIIGLEEDLSEIKKLLRGVSQRLPVIVE